MKRIALVIMAALSLTGCAGLSALMMPPAPASYAERTTLDESAALTAELAYKVAGSMVDLAVQAKIVKPGTPLAVKIADADDRAYMALQAVRSAYRTGNAGNYAIAATEARAAIEAMRAAVTGK